MKKNHILNLPDMTFKQTLCAAKMISGKTLETIAERSGIAFSSIKQYFDENRTDYFPSPHMISKLCEALGNDMLLEWLCARRDGCFVPNTEEALDLPLEIQIADLTKEFADVLTADGQARLDGRYSTEELSYIEQELLELNRSTNRLLKQIRLRKTAKQ